jgi:hypothetical protein
MMYVACIGAGIAIGIGLAALAEQLDGRIYNPSDFARLTGLPLITSLPKLHRGAPAEAQGAQSAMAYPAPVSFRTFGRVAPRAAE